MDKAEMQDRRDRLMELFTQRVDSEFAADMTDDQLDRLIIQRLDNPKNLALITAKEDFMKDPVSLPMGSAARLVQAFSGAAAASVAGGADTLHKVVIELAQLRRLGTWTPRTVQAVGQTVLEECKTDAILEGYLGELPFNIIPLDLEGIINSAFTKLAAASSEEDVQREFMLLFNALEQKVRTRFFSHDTSKKNYLKSPPAKIDFTFTSHKGQVTWPAVVWLAEAKHSLEDKGMYEEALGQVSDRAQCLFKQQPHRRYVIAALLGATSLEVVVLPQHPSKDNMRRTGKLALSQTVADPSAARMLLRLFNTGLDGFDFKPPHIPAAFDTTIEGKSCRLSDFECLRSPGTDVDAFRGAYQAVLPDGRKVVVKFGEEAAIRSEEATLLAVAHVPHTPRVLGSGKEPGFGSYLVITPMGRHAGADDPPVLIAQMVLDVANTIVMLAAQPQRILHCDISANNILNSPDGRGLLVDFGSALVGSGGPGAKGRVTGTVLFSALSVLWGEDNTVSSDLESLFYSLVYIALESEMPGSREPSPARVTAYKLCAMLHPAEFETRILQRCPQQLQPLLRKLHRLFFTADPSGYKYVKLIDPQDFVKVCEDELMRLQPAGGMGGKPPRGGGASPARGGGSIAALPVHNGRSHSHGQSPSSGLQGSSVQPVRKLLLPAVRRPLQLPVHTPLITGRSRICLGL